MKLNINTRLVRAIAQSGLDFEDVAIFTGIFPNVLVQVVRGKKTVTKDLQERIAAVLGRDRSDLFPEGSDSADAN